MIGFWGASRILGNSDKPGGYPTEAIDVLLDLDNGKTTLFQKETKALFELLKRTYMFSSEKRKGWISCGYGPFRRAYGSTTHGALTPQEQQQFQDLEADLNNRLVNYADSPENQSLQADLEYLKQVIREKRAGYAES